MSLSKYYSKNDTENDMEVDIIEFYKISDEVKSYLNNRLLMLQGVDIIKNVTLELKTNELGNSSLFIKGKNKQNVREVSLFAQGIRAGLNYNELNAV